MDPQQITEHGCPDSQGADGGGGESGESGTGSEGAAVGCCGDTFSGTLPEMEHENLEEKLRGLAFRKQISYR